MARLFKYLLRTQLRLIILIFATSILLAVLEGIGISVFFPLLQGDSMNLTSRLPGWAQGYFSFFEKLVLPVRMKLIAGILVTVVLLKLLVSAKNTALTLRLKNEVMRHYRLLCVQVVLRSGMGRFNGKKVSDLNTMIDTYIEVHIGGVVELIGGTLPSFFTLVILVFVLIGLSWKMMLAASVVVGIGGWVVALIAVGIRRSGQAMLDRKAVLNRMLLDILNGFRVIRVHNREETALAAFDVTSVAYNDIFAKYTFLTVIVSPVFELVGALILATVLFVGAFFVGHGILTLGVIFAFLIVLARLIPPFNSLNHARASIVARIPALNAVESFLTEDSGDVLDGKEVFTGLKTGFELRGVAFRYHFEQPLVLKDISFTVPKGARFGVVGSSGCGKSTLFELLLRFYDPEQGVILVDGKDLKGYNRGSWRVKVGVVSQDTFLFNDTVRSNIAFSKPGASDEEIIKAARRAYAHVFIESLPKGYDTFVGERGALLSGGQRQRIAIARALLSAPDILFFDEATSALDAESEVCVQKAVEELSAGRTVVTVAHRLATLINSDKIVVIDGGRVVEEGRHEDLLKANGLYRRYVETQTI